MGHAKMAHQQAGVRWPTDGFHNPFLSVFGNRSSVVKLSVQRRGVVQESQHAWLQATNGKRALQAPLCLMPTSPNLIPSRYSQLTAWYEQREDVMVTTGLSKLQRTPLLALRHGQEPAARCHALLHHGDSVSLSMLEQDMLLLIVNRQYCKLHAPVLSCSRHRTAYAGRKIHSMGAGPGPGLPGRLGTG